ncbi:hypothetical protein BJX61DRAFT_495175 [Aspergillus egyptiacus]|nr:hypothetical protein BJX61DRAFT_495175 [Aspergillus egyptiacus]
MLLSGVWTTGSVLPSTSSSSYPRPGKVPAPQDVRVGSWYLRFCRIAGFQDSGHPLSAGRRSTGAEISGIY